MSIGAGQVFDAVPLAPPRVSLLTSVDVITSPPRGWENGISWAPEACGPPDDPYWWDCPEGDGDTPVGLGNTKAIDAPESVIDYRPFDIWVGVTCGNQLPNAEMELKANRALEAFQSHLIEAELWTGAVAAAAGFPNLSLIDSPTQLNSGTALPYVSALAELEQALAGCQPGQTGVIHAQPRVVTAWIQNGLVVAEPNGRRLRTLLGTIVVPGSGYPGTGDGLAAATAATSYAYGTGMVRVLLGPVSNLDTGDRGFDHETATNTTVVRLERTVAAVWDDCCQVAIEVTLTEAV